MSSTKNITIGVLVAVAVVLGVFVIKQPTTVTRDVVRVETVQVPTLGSQPAPVVNVPAPIVNIPAPVVKVTMPELSGASGSQFFSRVDARAGISSGGRTATTSTAATYTTRASDFVNTPTYIDWLPNVNTTVSISGTSTMAYVPNVGDVAKIYLRNASTTAAASITLAAADTGVDLQKNEDVADLAIVGLDWASLTLIRESEYLVTVLFAEFTEAD